MWYQIGMRFWLPIFLAAAAITPKAIAQKGATPAPTIDDTTRRELHTILQITRDEVKKNYYDPKFHGVDLDATYTKYDAKLNTVQTLNQGFAVIAGYLDQLHDSHLYFSPPMRVDESRMGFHYGMVGDKCFVMSVNPKSDAATKLHRGDQILIFNGFKPERSTFTTMSYYFGVLATTKTAVLSVQSPGGPVRKENVANDYLERSTLLDAAMDSGGMQMNNMRRESGHEYDLIKSRFLESGDLVVWKLHEFSASPEKIGDYFDQHVYKHKTLILDLRGNSGGSIETLKAMISHLIDHEVLVDNRVTRKPEKPETTKQARRVFDGKLYVLVDQRSASASEILARVVQLEHRGIVIGDGTAGAVMEAMRYPERAGISSFGLSITFADLKMSDGGDLEKVGVTPDEVLLPTGEDLATERDTVLEKVAARVGVTLDPAEVKKQFPVIWIPMQQW